MTSKSKIYSPGPFFVLFLSRKTFFTYFICVGWFVAFSLSFFLPMDKGESPNWMTLGIVGFIPFLATVLYGWAVYRRWRASKSIEAMLGEMQISGAVVESRNSKNLAKRWEPDGN